MTVHECLSNLCNAKFSLYTNKRNLDFFFGVMHLFSYRRTDEQKKERFEQTIKESLDFFPSKKRSYSFFMRYILFEPRCEKTSFLHMRKQRRRSASRGKLISAFVFAT